MKQSVCVQEFEETQHLVHSGIYASSKFLGERLLSLTQASCLTPNCEHVAGYLMLSSACCL